MKIGVKDIVQIPESDKLLLYNEQEIWYGSVCDCNSTKRQQIQLISYFSIPNNSFHEFKNNLTVQELENPAFMHLFADKLPIQSLHLLLPHILVLYQHSLLILHIAHN